MRDVIFDMATGIAHLNLHGACQGCPQATATLKQSIEKALMWFPNSLHWWRGRDDEGMMNNSKQAQVIKSSHKIDGEIVTINPVESQRTVNNTTRIRTC